MTVPEPPPVCDPCPCSSGEFGEPELVAGLALATPAFGPAPSADGLTLFFSSLGTTEDIFFATREARANQFAPAALAAGVNGEATEEGTPFQSFDGSALYFFSTRPEPAAVGDRDLWVAPAAGVRGEFGVPSLVPGVNSLELDHLPRLSADGSQLLFVSGRDSPNGASNIWVAERADAGFAEPVELAGVNTDAREEGFWLSEDGLTLYFASNRGDADMDIWVAVRGDRESPFEPAENLSIVNTPGIEIDPAVTTDGFELFFASDRNGTMQLYRSARRCL